MITIDDIKKRIASGQTVRSVVEGVFAKIEATKDYNLLISLNKDQALARADTLDAKIKKGDDIGVLGGVPFVAKDIFLATGTIATAGSKILSNFNSAYQATCVNKLEQEGAILVGKSNCDAFGNGSSTENSDFGVTKNPYDKTRVAGGSSGGSTAVVALGVVPFSIGGDTGGSCRQPASFCGVLGLKPTYGRVSRYGAISYASSLDTIGTIASCADDIGTVMDVIAGKDPFDSTTLPNRPASFMPKDNPIKPLRIGVVKEYMQKGVVQAEVLDSINDQLKKLAKLGHKIEEISIPTLDLSLAVYYIIAPAELSSNLLRYDGVKFGYSATEAKTLDELYGLSRDEGFNLENKRRILIGTYVLSSGYIDAYYRKAQTVRTKLINEFNDIFSKFDVLVGPVAPTTAFKIGENTDDPMQMYLGDIMTVAPSLVGIAALSVPSGKDKKGLPIGMQVMAAQSNDQLLISLAKQLEEVKE